MVNLTRNFFVSNGMKTKTLQATMQVVNNVFKIFFECERCNELKKKTNFGSENTMGGAQKFILDQKGLPID